MRILYHHRTLADGAEGVHIRAMVAAFEQLGHEVRVIGLAEGGASDRTSGLIQRVRGALPKSAFEMASAAVNVPEYMAVRGEIERFKPQIVYKRHARFDIAATIAAHRLGVPLVLEVNCVYAATGYQQFEPLALPRVERAFERRAFGDASVIVAVSSPLAREVRAIVSREVLVVPNGADPDWFDPRRADGGGVRTSHGLGSALVVGWTGILREWHGLAVLLEAIARLPSARLMIVGDGPGRGALEERATALGIIDRVVITGRVPHARVRDYVAAFDIAVVADERTGVASPMKMLEYMALERAVVAPNTENIADVVDDAVDGLLFTAGSVDELTAALRRLATDVSLRHTFGVRARTKIQRERNWLSIATRVLGAVSAASPELNAAQSS